MTTRRHELTGDEVRRGGLRSGAIRHHAAIAQRSARAVWAARTQRRLGLQSFARNLVAKYGRPAVTVARQLDALNPEPWEMVTVSTTVESDGRVRVSPPMVQDISTLIYLAQLAQAGATIRVLSPHAPAWP